MKKEYSVSLKDLFFIFFKIGLFTFGGGYAMMAMMQQEFVEKRKWISAEDMLDIVAISESTPGPVAVNSATSLGYQMHGFWGAVVATVSEILPAFSIMYVLSLFLNEVMDVPIIKAAFNGIQCAVAVLILRAGFSLWKSIKKDVSSLFIFAVVSAVLLLVHIFQWNFSSLLCIIFGALVGLCVGLFSKEDKEETK